MEFTIDFLEILFIQGVNSAFIVGGMYVMIKNLVARVDKQEERMNKQDEKIMECRLSGMSPTPVTGDNRTKKSTGYYA